MCRTPLIVAALCAISATGTARAELPKGASVTFEHGDDRVGTYVSSPWGFSTNTFWIEGDTGLILIDTQFLPSAIEEAVGWIESTTNKKIALAIVLHANPDKFNGTAFLKSRGIKVVTSEGVRKLIPAVHEKRKRAFYERYKPDYPENVTLPDSFGKDTAELSAGGVTVKAHVFGAGCSDAHVVVQFGKHIFPGDLVANGSHSWLELGHVYEWLDRLDELSAMEPKFVHPGRGPSGGAELLVRERAYLERVVAIAKDDVAAWKKDVEAAYPGYRFAPFLDFGLPAVKDALKSRRAKATVSPIAIPALVAKIKDASKTRAVVVNVWATWCSPCVDEMPALLRLHRKYRDRGLDLILLSADAPDARTGAEEMLRQLGADFPSLLKTGTDNALIDALEPRWSGALPATLIYGKGGKKTYFIEGQFEPEKLEAELRAVLGLGP